MEYTRFVKYLGSSLVLRANGQGWSSATVLAAHFAKRNSQSFFLAPKGELQSDNNSAKRNCLKAILLKK